MDGHLMFNRALKVGEENRVTFPNKAATMNDCVLMGLKYEEKTIQAVRWMSEGKCVGYHSTDISLVYNWKVFSQFTHWTGNLLDPYFFCYIFSPATPGGTGHVSDPDFQGS